MSLSRTFILGITAMAPVRDIEIEKKILGVSAGGVTFFHPMVGLGGLERTPKTWLSINCSGVAVQLMPATVEFSDRRPGSMTATLEFAVARVLKVVVYQVRVGVGDGRGLMAK
jgi:hypothetical protein